MAEWMNEWMWCSGQAPQQHMATQGVALSAWSSSQHHSTCFSLSLFYQHRSFLSYCLWLSPSLSLGLCQLSTGNLSTSLFLILFLSLSTSLAQFNPCSVPLCLSLSIRDLQKLEQMRGCLSMLSKATSSHAICLCVSNCSYAVVCTSLCKLCVCSHSLCFLVCK